MKRLRVPVILLALLISIMTLGVSVSAISVFFLNDPSSLSGAEKAAGNAIEKEVTMFQTTSTGEGGGTGYYFDRATYDSLTRKQQKTWIKAFVKYINDNPINSADKQILYNALKEVDDKYITAEISYLLNDTGSSMFTAIRILSPFTSVVGVVLGVIAILLIMGVMIMTVIDIACLSIPMFAVKSDGEKPKYLSKDAFNALKKAESEGGNVYWLYFKRRLTSYIVLIMCVIYLISGSLGDLFMKIVDLFQSFTNLGG